MDVNKAIKDLMEISEDGDLVKLVKKLNTEMVKNIIQTLFTNKTIVSKAVNVISSLYKGMPDPMSAEKRFVVTRQILENMKHTERFTKSMIDKIIRLTLLSIDKLSTDQLVVLTKSCTQDIVNNADPQFTWKEVLPKLLKALENAPEVTNSGTKMTGPEYNSDVIKVLIMADWKDEILTPLAITLKNVKLKSDDEKQIINKFCESFANLDPEALVSLVRQLLILCEDRHGPCIFFSLQIYFNKWIYNAQAASQELDAIEELDFRKDAPNAQANLLLCISETVRNKSIIKQVYNSVTGLTNAPERLLEPFLITFLLSNNSDLPLKKVIELFKSAITRAIIEDKKRTGSAWVENLANNDFSVKDVLAKVIDVNHECESVMRGMIELAFELFVSKSVSMQEDMAEKLWYLGQFILVQIVRKKTKELGNVILSGICECIQTDKCPKQLIACIHKILKTSPSIVRDHSNIMITMMGLISHLSVPLGVAMVKALLPACFNMYLRKAMGLRDNLIMVLRKQLINPVLNSQLIAVNGMLHLLANLEIRNFGAISQSSCSQVYSQTRPSTDPSANVSEVKVTCLQILQWLSRCLKLQAEVKLALYKGLTKSVGKNPEILSSSCKMLLDHVKNFYKSNNDDLPPLDFNSIVTLVDDGAKLQEPLGHLVLVIYEVVTKPEEAADCKEELIEILESLVVRMPKCSLEDFDLVDESELTDVIPESCQKREKTQQILTVYEALMNYVVDSWDLTTKDQGKKLVALFKGYNKILEFAKPSAKGKKVDRTDGNKAKDKNDSLTVRHTVKRVVFTVPATILDLPIVCKMLQLFYETSVSWSTDGAKNQVMSYHDLLRYIINATLELIKRYRTEEDNDPANINFFIQIASTLYRRVICNLEEQLQYDATATMLSLRAFNELLSLVRDNYKNKIRGLIAEVVGVTVAPGEEEAAVMKMINTLERIIRDLIDAEEDEKDMDAETKTIPIYLVALLKFITYQLPPLSPETKEVLDWLEELVTGTVVRINSVAIAVIQFYLDLRKRHEVSEKHVHSLVLQLQRSLGVSDSQYDNQEDFQSLDIVTEVSEVQVIVLVCNSIKLSLSEIDWIVSRMTSENVSISLPKSTDVLFKSLQELKAKEREVCVRITRCVRNVFILAATNIPNTYKLETTILKLFASLYLSLCGLTKYFMKRSSTENKVIQGVRFDELINLCGNQLSESVHAYIDIVQNKVFQTGGKEGKKTAGDKSKSVNKIQIQQEGKIISTITYNKEQFENSIAMLSKKTKVNLTQYIRMSGLRDFRIKTKKHSDQSMAATANQSMAATANQSMAGTSRKRSETADDTQRYSKKKRAD